MAIDEEKEDEGREPEENEAAGPELTDLGSAAQSAPDGETGGQETAGEEPGEEETPAEKKEKKFWLLALGLMLLLLAGGGFFAVTGMRQAAHKLGGGQDYDQLSANSSIYDGKAGASGTAADPFPLDEETARAQAVGGPGGGRVNPSLLRTKEELTAEASGKRAVQGAATNWEQDPDDPADPRAAAGQAAMAEKLQAGAGLPGGFAGSRGDKNSPAAAAGATGAFQGSGTVIGKPTEQRETKSSTPKGAARGSAMEGLKSAFRANFYGARLASHDSARGWIARAFDGTQEAATAIEYDEKMRAKLDRVNPDSIPGFLREQDVSAAEARTLSVSKVAKAKLDKEGTREALAEDKDYQKKKLAGELSGGTLNGLFGPPGTNPPDSEDPPNDENPPEEEDGPSGLNFVDPDDKADLEDLGLNEYVDTHGFGEECGCSEAAPCCCLPQNTASQGCPLYGPFLPNDPCGAAMYGAGAGAGGGLMAGQ